MSTYRFVNVKEYNDSYLHKGTAPDVWIGPPIPQDWGYKDRPQLDRMNLYWNEPERLHAHWIVRSGARIDASFASMDETFRSWNPTKAHLAVREQPFKSWSNFDCEEGKRIVHVPYLLRAVSGSSIDVAMEALSMLFEHLYHQNSTAGGVSLILPVLARLSLEGLTLLSGSIDAFLCLAQEPHVKKILPDFPRPPRTEGPRQITYRLPGWGVFPNEIHTILTLDNGKRHREVFATSIDLDHQQPFSDRTGIGWGQNALRVARGQFAIINNYEDDISSSGFREVRVNDVIVERGMLAPGGRQRQGKPIGPWSGAWPDGSPRFLADYIDGKREGIVRTFSIEGTTLTECNYKKNKRQGPWRQWFPNGQLVTEGRFTGNAPSGRWKGYYPDGTPRFEGSFREGLRFGPWRYWDRDGMLSERTHNYD